MTALLIDALLLALLAATAVIIARARGLLAAVMLTGIYSFLSASWMLVLDAPDVAFTEAAVGAGVSTIFLLGTLALTTTRAARPRRSPVLPLLIVVVTGAFLTYGTMDMPRFGEPDNPIQVYPEPGYVEKQKGEIDVPNVVTGVLASYRGYDTLGETAVVFTAAVGVLLLLRGRPRRKEDMLP